MTGPSSPGESSEQEPRSVRREVKTCCASTHVETYKGEYEISAFINIKIYETLIFTKPEQMKHT